MFVSCSQMIADCIRTINLEQTWKNCKKIYIDFATGVKNGYWVSISKSVKLSPTTNVDLNKNFA